jgi:electron transfer flavoprotein beta subunit
LNIIVCIKQVPDTNDVTIDPETNRLNRAGVPSIINPFDRFALEIALILKEKYEGKVTVITMGPEQALHALKDAYGLGADEIILLSDRAFGGADTLATSYTLAHAIKKIGDYDLILCGKQAIDGDTGQVGTGMAEWLDIPQVVCGVDVEIVDGKVRVKKELDDVYEIIEMGLPSIVTISKAFELRNPNIRRRLQATKMDIPVWGWEDLKETGIDENALGLKGSPTKVRKVFAPAPRGSGIKVEGVSAAEMAQKLTDYFIEEHIL